MKRNSVSIFVMLMMAGALGAWAQVCEEQDRSEKSAVDAVLEQLNKNIRELKTYECQIERKYVQPLHDSQTIYKGMLYYMQSGGKSALRVDFTTVKVEDQKERKAVEQYIILDGAWLNQSDRQFKGIWLAHIDHQLKQVEYCQLTEPEDSNDSINVFDLVSNYLPILDFTRTEELKKRFEVALVEHEKGESGGFAHVSLKVKPNSAYKEGFLSIELWIVDKVSLPSKVRIVKAEPEYPNGDIDEIRLLNPKVNKDISRKTFEVKIPRGFGQPEIMPLKEEKKRIGTHRIMDR